MGMERDGGHNIAAMIHFSYTVTGMGLRPVPGEGSLYCDGCLDNSRSKVTGHWPMVGAGCSYNGVCYRSPPAPCSTPSDAGMPCTHTRIVCRLFESHMKLSSSPTLVKIEGAESLPRQASATDKRNRLGDHLWPPSRHSST